MLASEWKEIIIKACKDAGTYQDYFMMPIDNLADTMEKRDKAQSEYERTGCKIVIPHTNKNGSTNLEQNPILRMINDLDGKIRDLWRELGLTPSSLKRINESAVKSGAKKETDLTRALKALAGGADE